MRIAPFYSRFRGIAVEDVWHDDDECQIGLSIVPADRLSGTADRKHCAYCVMHSMPRLKRASATGL